MGNLQAFRLGRVAHDVERVDEGVELLHLEVVGDQGLCAGGEAGYGELDRVVVQTAHRERSVGVAAVDVGHLLDIVLVGAIELQLEVGGREGGIGGGAVDRVPRGEVVVAAILFHEACTFVARDGQRQLAIHHVPVATEREAVGLIDVSGAIGDIFSAALLHREIIVAAL